MEEHTEEQNVIDVAEIPSNDNETQERTKVQEVKAATSVKEPEDIISIPDLTIKTGIDNIFSSDWPFGGDEQDG